MPNLYVTSGCNGIGKTASYTVSPEILDYEEFINTDETARLSPLNPDKAAIEAGRIM